MGQIRIYRLDLLLAFGEPIGEMQVSGLNEITLSSNKESPYKNIVVIFLRLVIHLSPDRRPLALGVLQHQRNESYRFEGNWKVTARKELSLLKMEGASSLKSAG
jgi:hypothetical protein